LRPSLPTQIIDLFDGASGLFSLAPFFHLMLQRSPWTRRRLTAGWIPVPMIGALVAGVAFVC